MQALVVRVVGLREGTFASSMVPWKLFVMHDGNLDVSRRRMDFYHGRVVFRDESLGTFVTKVFRLSWAHESL